MSIKEGMGWRCRARLVVLAIAVGLGACGTAEPTDAELRSAFERHRPQLDELRHMFAEDVNERHMWRIPAKAIEDVACGELGNESFQEGISCIDEEHWSRYANLLRSVGALSISRGPVSGIMVEVSLYRPFFSSLSQGYRARGFVYDPGVPTVAYPIDDTEQRIELGDGWYSYLWIDD